ncbi:hypothetical protein RB595_003071 [Gaeumannomyces hyphopodioides]
MSDIYLDMRNHRCISHQRAREILEWIDRIAENSTRAGAEHEHEDELAPFPSASLLRIPDTSAGPGSLTMPRGAPAPSTPSPRTDPRRFGMLSPKDHQPACGMWSENGHYTRDPCGES